MNGKEIKGHTDFNNIQEISYSDQPELINDNGIQENQNNNPPEKVDEKIYYTNNPDNEEQNPETINKNLTTIEESSKEDNTVKMSKQQDNNNNFMENENAFKENGQNDIDIFARESIIPKNNEDFDDLMSCYGQNYDIEKMVNNFDFERQEFSMLEEDYLEVIEIGEVDDDTFRKITKSEINNLKLAKEFVEKMDYEGKIISTISDIDYLLLKAKNVNENNRQIIKNNLETKKDNIYAWREILPGNDSFFRSVMFNFIEQLILSRNKNMFRIFIFEFNNNIEDHYFQEILKYYKIEFFRVKIYLILIYCMLFTDEKSATEKAYSFFIKIYNSEINFDPILILNLKFQIYKYLKNNENRLYTQEYNKKVGHLLPIPYKSGDKFNFKKFYVNNLLQLGQTVAKISLLVIPFILRRDLFIYNFNGNDINHIWIHTDGKENKDFLPIRLFFFNDNYYIIYSKNYYLQFENIFNKYSSISNNSNNNSKNKIQKVENILDGIDDIDEKNIKSSSIPINDLSYCMKNNSAKDTINNNNNINNEQNNNINNNQINNYINNNNNFNNGNYYKGNNNFDMNYNNLNNNLNNNNINNNNINNNYNSLEKKISNQINHQENNNMNNNYTLNNQNNNFDNHLANNQNNYINNNNQNYMPNNNFNKNNIFNNNNMNKTNNNFNNNANINNFFNTNNNNINNNNNFKNSKYLALNNNNNINNNYTNKNSNNINNTKINNNNNMTNNYTNKNSNNINNARGNNNSNKNLNSKINNNKPKIATGNESSNLAKIFSQDINEQNNVEKCSTFREFNFNKNQNFQAATFNQKNYKQILGLNCPGCNNPGKNGFYCEKCILDTLIKNIRNSYIQFIKTNISNIINEKPKENFTKFLSSINIIFPNKTEKKFSETFDMLNGINKNIYNSQLNLIKSSLCLGCFNYIRDEAKMTFNEKGLAIKNKFLFKFPCGCIFCSDNCLNKFLEHIPIKNMSIFVCACGEEYNCIKLKYLLYFAISHNLIAFKEEILRIMYEYMKNKCCICNTVVPLIQGKKNNFNIVEISDIEIDQIFKINKFNHLVCNKCAKNTKKNLFYCKMCSSEHSIINQKNINGQIRNNCVIF